MRDFLRRSNDSGLSTPQSESVAAASTSLSTTSCVQTTIGACSNVSTKDVLRAEIIWALNIVLKHCSFKSSEKAADLFGAMFPDSEIAYFCAGNASAIILQHMGSHLTWKISCFRRSSRLTTTSFFLTKV